MAVHGVPKPSFIQTVHWMNVGLICRAEEMTLVSEPVVSTAYTLDKAPELSDQWWEELSTALEHLAITDTDRVSLVQEDIDRSVREAFGTSPDTTVSHWVIGHGDLHWANLTAPCLFLLDWDNWGLMPRGLDAAKLWESAFRVPGFAEEITERLAPDLACRDGKLSQLWVCANRALGARRRNQETDQTRHAQRAGEVLLAELS
ncbi:phosphotransferase [Nocardiopsis sp. NPDC058631]|uniref:phosphotransferase n=1 Tax=Nocardiopsis sp. NPDC058631 TaxID=3346566 RepID=UPI00364D5D41